MRKPKLVEERRDVPELAADIPFADEVHVVGLDPGPFRRGGRRGRLAGADHALIDDVARQAIAEVLVAVEARAIDGNDGHAEPLRRQFRDRFDIVAVERRNAGVVDENSRWLVRFGRLPDGLVQALLAAAHDDVHVVEIGRHADPIGIDAARARAAIIPRRARAADRAVNDMGGVGDRQQRIAGAIETAAALRRPRLRLRAAGFRLGVLRAGRLVHQSQDLLVFHAAYSCIGINTARGVPAAGSAKSGSARDRASARACSNSCGVSSESRARLKSGLR